MRMSGEALKRCALLSTPLLFLTLFFFYPLFMGILPGINDNGLTGTYVYRILSDPYYRKIISFTTFQAIASTILTVLLGLPGAYLISHYGFRGKPLVKAMTTIPFIMPSLMVAMGFILLFGNRGFFTGLLSGILGHPVNLDILYSWKAIILVHAFYNFPIVMRMVGSSWERMDADLEDAARTLGASPWQRFRHVTLPYLYPSIMASALLTFIFCFMSFAIVLILGGVRYTTVEVSIYTLSNVMIKPHMASAMAIIQISVSLVFMYLYLKMSGCSIARGRQRPMRKLHLKDIISLKGLGIAGYSILITVLVLGPMLAVIYSSFTFRSNGPTLRWYQDVFSSKAESILGISPVEAIFNSLYFATLAVSISLILSLLLSYALYRRKNRLSLMDPLFMLPMGISSVTLGFGMIQAFINPPLQIYGSWWAIVVAHTVISFPFVFRAVSNSVRSMNPELTEAAKTLGANGIQSFLMVELPQIMPGIIVGLTFGFAISIGEFGATLMLYRPEYSTIPIAIYRFLGSRNFGAATSMSVILMLFAGISFLMIERFSGEKVF